MLTVLLPFYFANNPLVYNKGKNKPENTLLQSFIFYYCIIRYVIAQEE
jgi:hypothetical protein